ncbi:MAG: hypothetical protein KC964_08645, partial [Candidatus Omnitrophica bacterium]|nr:hypothetical protein [Candidatus Omnitrophota bacterium]
NKKNLITALKQKALLLAKNKKWQASLDCILDLEKVASATKETETNKAFLMGRIAYEMADTGNYGEAGHRWKRALRLDPDNSELIHNIAVCSTLMINREEEEKYWVDTLRAWHKELSHKGEDAYLKNLIIETHKRFGGKYLHKTGDDNLREQIRKSMDTSGESFHRVDDPSGASRPGSKKAGGSTPEARPEPSPSVDLNSHLGKGMDAYGKRNWKGAIASFELHLKDHSDDGPTWDKLAWALLHDNKGNSAFKLWEKMLEKGPDPERAKESLVQAKLDTARMLKKKMMLNPALAQLKSLQKIVPDSSEVFQEIGLLYAEKEDWPNASYYYDKALETNPNEKTLRTLAREAKTRARSLRARA